MNSVASASMAWGVLFWRTEASELHAGKLCHYSIHRQTIPLHAGSREASLALILVISPVRCGSEVLSNRLLLEGYHLQGERSMQIESLISR